MDKKDGRFLEGWSVIDDSRMPSAEEAAKLPDAPKELKEALENDIKEIFREFGIEV